MSESIRAVERALDVLLCFSEANPELTMTQISLQVRMNKSTVHRLLGTLEKKRFVQRDPVTGTYRLGIRFLQMAYLAREKYDLRRLAQPYMRQLSEKYRENVNLAVLDEAEVIYVDVIESPQRIKLAATPGQRLPAFSTASGKSILAFLPEGEVQKILKRGLPRYTSRTIVNLAELTEDFNQARQQGYAISEQEFEEGINAVATPILDPDGSPVGSISVAGPAARLPRDYMQTIGKQLQAAAQELMQDMLMTGVIRKNHTQ